MIQNEQPLGSGMNLFMDPSYMDSFFPFPPIENDAMSTHSGGSIPVQQQQHQPSPHPVGFFGHQNPGPGPGPGAQQSSQQGPPWW